MKALHNIKTTGVGHREADEVALPIPVTYLLDASVKVIYTFADTDDTKRASLK
jgi:hypothetical protein